MQQRLADTSFGLSSQALAVAQLLAGIEADVVVPAGVSPDSIEVRTYPLYNGRERGICLSVSSLLDEQALLIFFGEHRNSDSLFVQDVEAQKRFNGPTLDDLSEDSYNKRPLFEVYDYRQVVDYIIALMRSYLSMRKEKQTSQESAPVQGATTQHVDAVRKIRNWIQGLDETCDYGPELTELEKQLTEAAVAPLQADILREEFYDVVAGNP